MGIDNTPVSYRLGGNASNLVTMPNSNMLEKNQMAEIIKELFDEKKIYMISDLTSDEIKLVTRIYMIADMKDIKVWKTGLVTYLKLVLSRKRESRRETIEAIKGLIGKRSLGDRIKNVFTGTE